MLNCTLNTEQYSCPFFILFTLHLLHIHTYRTYRPTHTHYSFKEFVPSCSKQPAHTHCAQRNSLISCINSEFSIYFWMCCTHSLNWPTLLCHKSWLCFQQQFLCLLCSYTQTHYVLGMYITILSVPESQR